MTTKIIKNIECKFAINIPTRASDLPDVHLIKELIQYEDGSFKPNLKFIKNYQRPFWITNPGKRNHKDKKEYEELENLSQVMCTQSELRHQIAKVLGKPWAKDTVKQLCLSPYIYGSDITSTAIIKKQYLSKYPEAIFKSTVAVYDIETDMVYGTGAIVLATVVFENKILTVATELFLQGFSTPEVYVEMAYNKYLKEVSKELNLEYEFRVVKKPSDAVKAVFRQVHEWQPDYLAVWNMDFDIPRTIKALEDDNIDPKTILCDPRVPKEFRRCEYKEGRKKKVTASGKISPITPSSQWHTFYLTASFYVIDAMAVYKRIRTPPAPELPSYSLDAILTKELNRTKLKFTEADAYTGGRWHEFMQRNYKAEYVVYNMYDCIAILQLDAKTNDLAFTISSFAGTTDFEKYTSNPRKIHDELHWFYLNNNKVISSTGSVPYADAVETLPVEEEDISDIDPDDEALKSLSLRGWILTLTPHMTSDSGLQIITEDPNMRTNIRGYVYDSDAISAYPSATIAGNVSKSTTRKELSTIVGIDEYLFRMQNINLLSGPTDSVEYCVNMFSMPTLDTLLDMFKLDNHLE